VLFVLAGGLFLGGHQTAQEKAAPREPASTLRVTTRLVLVDVVVTDKKGQPVTDLTVDDFVVKEGGQRQQITSFSLEQPLARAEQPVVESPAMPPDVYTNRYVYTRQSGPLTILLLDGLNTPVEQQSFVRQKMLDYVATQLQPDQRVAVLALTKRLWLLQDFTSDSRALLAALDGHTAERSTLAQRGKLGISTPPDVEAALASIGGLSGGSTQEAVTQMLADMEASSIAERVGITLGALQAIVRMTAGYPGRKNLIWVSAGFPISLDPEINQRFAPALGQVGIGLTSFSGEIRRTADLLTNARVAIYPVDARGLVGWSPELAASTVPSVSNPRGVRREGWAADLLPRRGETLNSQMAMEQLATETGGRVFKDRNDIDVAVANSIADGSTYYVLGYRPPKGKWNGKFRSIKVKVARKGVQVRHRRGYYAIDLRQREVWSGKTREQEFQAALSDPIPAAAVIFRVRIPPPEPAAVARVQIEFRVDVGTIAWDVLADGDRECKLDFYVAAYTEAGEQVDSYGLTTEARLGPENYAEAARLGLGHQMELDLKAGKYRLRLLVRDVRTGLLGRVDAPLEIFSLRRRP
jgi:VWFA-related protein